MTIKTFPHGDAEYEQMISLRTAVLLNPIGIPATYINSAKEKEDILIGAFDETTMIGCCVLTEKEVHTVQLRQMAVLPDRQKEGIGAAILQFAEGAAKDKGYHILMMHARDVVIPFYAKCGYQISGEAFTEVGIPHHPMQKVL